MRNWFWVVATGGIILSELLFNSIGRLHAQSEAVMTPKISQSEQPMTRARVAPAVPFINAVRRDDWPGAEALLKQGINIDIHDNYGRTALHYAAALDRPNLVARLLDAGATPDVQDNEGFTPLHRSVQKNSSLTVHALIEAGANPRLTNHAGLTAKDLVLELGFTHLDLEDE